MNYLRNIFNTAINMIIALFIIALIFSIVEASNRPAKDKPIKEDHYHIDYSIGVYGDKVRVYDNAGKVITTCHRDSLWYYIDKNNE